MDYLTVGWIYREVPKILILSIPCAVSLGDRFALVSGFLDPGGQFIESIRFVMHKTCIYVLFLCT